WFDSTGSLGTSYMYANDTGEVEVRRAIAASGWTKLDLNVTVSNNQMTIGFHSDAGAGAWIGIDLVELVHHAIVEASPVGEEIPIRGFEDAITNWSESGDASSSFAQWGGYNSDYALTHYADSNYEVRTYQTLTGLSNGYYTLTGWTQ